VRRTLPVLAMIALLAAPLAGCSGDAKSADPAAAANASSDASDPGVDTTPSLDGGQPVPNASAAAAQVASTEVGKLMSQLGCHQPELVETDPLSTQTGMCELTGDVIIATFASAAKRDEWVHQAVVSGMGTIVGPLWAAGVEDTADTPTVVSKLNGTAH
jgi:hypothetical protein